MTLRYRERIAISALLVTGSLTLGVLAFGQSAEPPFLTIAPGSEGQIQIAITNAVATTNYEIYRTPRLEDPNHPWTLHLIGDVGQSNFTADMGVENSGFFKAAIGSDFDHDGVPNFQDANPYDAAIGILSITIDSPTNGAVVP